MDQDPLPRAGPTPPSLPSHLLPWERGSPTHPRVNRHDRQAVPQVDGAKVGAEAAPMSRSLGAAGGRKAIHLQGRPWGRERPCHGEHMVLCHLSLASGPGGSQLLAVKRPAPATWAQLTSREGGVSAWPPTRLQGNGRASSRHSSYLKSHPVWMGVPTRTSPMSCRPQTKMIPRGPHSNFKTATVSVRSSTSPLSRGPSSSAGGTWVELALSPPSEPLLSSGKPRDTEKGGTQLGPPNQGLSQPTCPPHMCTRTQTHTDTRTDRQRVHSEPLL